MPIFLHTFTEIPAVCVRSYTENSLMKMHSGFMVFASDFEDKVSLGKTV